MADPFVAEIRIVSFDFAPVGWALCDGQIIPISQNTALFSLIGTFYGGNGTSNFALPNIQGQTVMGVGNGPGLTLREIGETVGESAHVLTTQELPQHGHTIGASAATANTSVPNAALPAPANANVRFTKMYGTATTGTTTNLGSAGGSVGHNNWQPYLVLNYVIALQGVFPPRS